MCFENTHPYSSPSSSRPTNPSHLCVLLSSLNSPLSPVYAVHVLLVWVIHGSMVDLLEATSLKKTVSPAPRCHRLVLAPQLGVGLMKPILISLMKC